MPWFDFLRARRSPTPAAPSQDGRETQDGAVRLGPGAPFDPRTRRFRNPPSSPRRPEDEKAWRAFMKRRMGDRTVPDIPAGHSLSLERTLAGLRAHHGIDSITWIGHACFLLRLGGATMLLDPYLSAVAGPRGLGPRRFVPPALAADRLPPIDLLAVSHNHYDHLDLKAIRALPGKRHMTVVVPIGLGAYFTRRGYRDVRELDWGRQTARDGVTVTAVPAVHFSKRTPFDRNRSLWAGFAIEGAGRRVYFAGDSAYGPVFAEWGERLGGFDLGLVGIGAYEPRALMVASHTSPEEAVALGRDLGCRALVGMHWGTIKLTDEPPFEPPGRFRAAGREAGYAAEDLWVMKIGETRAIPSRRGEN
ncbi:MAG: MBL fold metallo-hydrolase [Alphaproteobacteria bacterium]|nr:MBL fold metallo-hydrolase [Alphaproteobacteria bacterium]